MTAACDAVIHGHMLPSPGQSPELPAISRMLWYFPLVMFLIVSLCAKEFPTGSHMLDWPLQCQTSPNTTFEMLMFEKLPSSVQPVHTAEIV